MINLHQPERVILCWFDLNFGSRLQKLISPVRVGQDAGPVLLVCHYSLLYLILLTYYVFTVLVISQLVMEKSREVDPDKPGCAMFCWGGETDQKFFAFFLDFDPRSPTFQTDPRVIVSCRVDSSGTPS